MANNNHLKRLSGTLTDHLEFKVNAGENLKDDDVTSLACYGDELVICNMPITGNLQRLRDMHDIVVQNKIFEDKEFATVQ